jgi:glycosyltransferase involved in cell wall biosynthesis
MFKIKKPKMKKIVVYLRNKSINPSNYYRVVQYLDTLNVSFRQTAPHLIYYFRMKSNNQIVIYILKLIELVYGFFFVFFSLILDYFSKPKYIIISKVLIPRINPFYSNFLLNKISKNSSIYWDFDDDILFSKEIHKTQFDLLSKLSNRIIVTHNTLLKTIALKYQKKVIILVTTDNYYNPGNHNKLKSINFKRQKLYSNQVNIVWLGTRSNLSNIDLFLPHLDYVSKIFKSKFKKSINLYIISNKQYIRRRLSINVKNVSWTRKITRDILFNSHLGIMPLNDGTYQKGKGSFKIVQYLSSGLPVLASNVGFNKKVIKPGINGELVENNNLKKMVSFLNNLFSDYKYWEKLSYNAYEDWKLNYNYLTNKNIWMNLINYGN